MNVDPHKARQVTGDSVGKVALSSTGTITVTTEAGVEIESSQLLVRVCHH